MDSQKTITLMFTILFAFSCHSSEKSDSLEKYKVTEVSTLSLGFEEELKKIGEFTLPLDDLSTYELYNVRYFESGEEESLYVLNNLNTSIDIYSLNNEKLIKRIDYQTEGPEGIGQVQGFTVANEDSIFLFPKFKLTGSLLLDGNGNMINRYNPDIDDPEIKGHINHISGNSNQTYFFGNKLFFHRYAFFKVDDPEFIYDFSFDIVSEETRWLPFATLPNKYLEKDWFSPYFTDSRLALNENEWVYSWSLLDSLIYIRDDDGKISRQVHYAGDEAMVAPVIEPKDDSPELYDELLSQITHYGQILFSPELEQFYRVLYLKPKEDMELRQGESSIFYRDFILITLDREFNILNKTRFGSGVYDPRVMFAGRQGLYLPRISPLYSGLSEDKVTYDIYGLLQ